MPDPSKTAELNRLWAALAIDTCVSRGVAAFFLAPGSRCTPLTLAAAEHPQVHCIQHFDERGLAYACLGYARATGKPGVFVCTSGTAVANAYPAVIEASIDQVPMLLLTADRPPELRDTGANQTIDQCRIFGSYTRWFCDMPCPTRSIDSRVVRSQLVHAIEMSEAGPVHVNFMFREPLFESGGPVDLSHCPALPKTAQAASHWNVTAPGGDTLVVLGSSRREHSQAAAQMARRLGCPLLADVTSGVRRLAYDHVLGRPDSVPPPRTVIHVGGRVTSKRLWAYLDTNPPDNYVHVNPSQQRIDPTHRKTDRIVGPLDAVCESMQLARPSSPEFLSAWEVVSDRCQSIFRELLDHLPQITEPGIARAVARLMPDGHGLFLGNSLPIRHMDMFGFWPDDRGIEVGANRGASGIDGLIASASGFSQGLGRPTTLVVGDLATLHDLNSLALLRNVSQPLVAIVLNNDGGGIFHLLPIAKQTPHFERYFATPHGLEFEKAAEMFGLTYTRPENMQEFDQAYLAALSRPAATVIEVRTDRRQNSELLTQIRSAL